MVYLMIQSLPAGEEKDIILQIYDKYSGMIRGKARNVVGNRADVDDIEQEVFIRVIKHAADFGKLNERQTTAYLSIVVRNVAIDFLRKKNVEVANEVLFDLLEIKIEKFDSASCELEKDELFELMFVHGLDEVSAKIMFEKYIEKATLKEISQRYKMPIGTVSTILNRGKEKFKKSYGGLKDEN
ncbi:MAG: sigma-70 family RNA polymerase sigma factor [Bacillota bacterium]